jgi:hypothetical protein
VLLPPPSLPKEEETTTINNGGKMNSYYHIFIRQKMTKDDREATDFSKNERNMKQSQAEDTKNGGDTKTEVTEKKRVTPKE